VLTLEQDASPLVQTRGVRIEVHSVVVRLALRYVSEEHGWAICVGQQPCRCLRVSDQCVPGGGPIDVLITRDRPSDCQLALDAILSGAARSVVLWDEPNALGPTVESLDLGSTVIPERVIRLAQDAPRLNDRLRRTLELVAAGRSNAEISVALHQSASTTKRDIAELLKRFDAGNRAALTTTANRLGFLT
jgi:DNA-binding NarL/FixJ family response regulator